MTARVFRRLVPVLLLPIATAPLAAQGPTGRAWCAGNVGDSVYYSSTVFDNHMKAGSAYRSRVMSYEYTQYLYGHYDMGHAGPFAGTCGSYTGTVLAETARQTAELQATQAKKRLVSVPWSYDPDSAEVEFSYTAQSEQGYTPDLPRRKDDEGFCVTDTYAAPLYTSAVFPVPSSGANLAEWQIAWMKYLGGKYGYKGEVYCSNNGRGDPRRMVAARVRGAKDAGRKIIETGWSYTRPAAVAAKPDDDDPEPKPGAAPAPPPPAKLGEVAAKTSNDALIACQNDRMVNGAMDCNMVQRMVYNYIMAHPAEAATPAAAFLANDKLNCKDCINQFAETWASNRAMSNGFSGPKSQCVGPKFLAAIKAKPYVNRVKELFDAAMKACPR